MAEIIRFEAGARFALTLKYDGGKQTVSQYGPQLMYSTMDGRIFYLDLDSEPVKQMQRLGIKANVPFRITKKTAGGRGAKAEWLVERLDSTEEQLEKSVEMARNGERPGCYQDAPRAVTAPVSVATRPQISSAPASGAGMTVASRIMAGCLAAAIDAANAAAQYSSAKGLSLSFGAEDIRAMAATLYIQHHRELNDQYRADEAAVRNGGAQWRQ